MQAVVESQSSRLASLSAEKEVASLGQQDESTGQGEWGFIYGALLLFIFIFILFFLVLASSAESDNKLSEVIQGYITQIEELK